MRKRVLEVALFAVAVSFVRPALGETLFQIPVEHNHSNGECQGTLVVRDDKVIFESRTVAGDGRIWEYGAIDRIFVKSEWEFHVYFSDREHGKGQKYVMKFRNSRPENQEALDYILGRVGRGDAGARQDGEWGFDLPYRLGVELDLNGNNCMGTLVLREDKFLFETGAVACSDRAFVREWDALKEYRRIKDNEFMLVLYKYGPSSPRETTRLRFWSKGGPVPDGVDRFLSDRAHGR